MTFAFAIDACAWDTVLIESGDAGSEEAAIHAQCDELRDELQPAGLFGTKCRTVTSGEPVIPDRCISRLSNPRPSDKRSIRDWEIWIGLRLQ